MHTDQQDDKQHMNGNFAENVFEVDLKSFGGSKGSLIALEQNTDVMPFDLKRVYYIYDVPSNERRGFHAHKQLKQLIVCPSGSCKIEVRTDTATKVFTLDRADKALFIGEPVWREMYDFSNGCALIVYADELYDPEDYIWDFEVFVRYRQKMDSACIA